jgi:hypothetical protein
VVGCRGGDLGAVDTDDADVDEAGARAELEHAAEELGDRALVTLAEAGDRGVVGGLARADHAEGDVLLAAALDRARRTYADRVGVYVESDHHLRVVRCATPAV